jgi:hypothetical protein
MHSEKTKPKEKIPMKAIRRPGRETHKGELVPTI